MLRKIIAAIEPWYDWGQINAFRIDAKSLDDESEGEVYYFEIQWFGIHFAVQIGRTPPRR